MGIQINGNTNNINAGIGSLSIEDLNELHIVGVATAANFKTGTSNLHSTGLNIFDLDVDGQTNLDHVSVAGVTTFSEDTKFIGALSGRDLQWDKSDNTLEFLDYTAAKFGTDNNLTIYHNAGNNNTYITENGVGSLLIGASDLYFQDVDSGTGHYYMICATGGRVQLNYDNSEKLRTTNAGITVTGAITATGTIETTGSELKITGTEPRLTFTDTDNNPDFQIWANAQRLSIYDSTNSATRIRIDSSGNIGMNTTTASDSTGSCRAYTFTRTDNNGQVRIILKNGTTGFGNGAGFHQGIDGVNAFIENRSEGGYLDLTTKHGGTVSTKLRIKSDGHALFNGLTSQDAQDTSTLAVQDGDSNIGILQIHSGGGETVGDLSGIAFSHGNDNITARAKAAIALRAIGTYGKGDLCFYVDTADDNVQVAAADEKLRITSAGNVGINSITPAEMIDVRGTSLSNKFTARSYPVSSYTTSTAGYKFGARGSYALSVGGSRSSNGSSFTMFELRDFNNSKYFDIEISFAHAGGGIHGSYRRFAGICNGYTSIQTWSDTGNVNVGGGLGFALTKPDANTLRVTWNGANSYADHYALYCLIHASYDGTYFSYYDSAFY